MSTSEPAAGEPPNNSARATGASDPWWKPSLAGGVTIVSLAAFFALILYLLPQTAIADPAWTRLVYLLTGVEAITFAAVGWLFGKEVHRAQAESAEKRADHAVRQKDDAVQEAATERSKGVALGEAVYALATERVSSDAEAPSSGFERKGVGGPPNPTRQDAAQSDALASLATLAARFYPEVAGHR